MSNPNEGWEDEVYWKPNPRKPPGYFPGEGSRLGGARAPSARGRGIGRGGPPPPKGKDDASGVKQDGKSKSSVGEEEARARAAKEEEVDQERVQQGYVKVREYIPFGGKGNRLGN